MSFVENCCKVSFNQMDFKWMKHLSQNYNNSGLKIQIL